MKTGFRIALALAIILWPRTAPASLFGEENVPLMKLVIGQIVELEKLASALEVAKEQREILSQINEGVNRTIQQIDAIEEIIRRAQGLDPKNIRRISELTDLIYEVRDLRERVREITMLRLSIASQAIRESGIQSETTYTMGQEMIRVGTTLSTEAASASPGRSAQLSASAGAAQTISSGVMLQTLSHMTQLQAMSLELQRSQIERDLHASDQRAEVYRSGVMGRVGGSQ